MEPIHVDLGDGTHPPVLVYPNGQWVTTTRNQARIEAFKLLFGSPSVGVVSRENGAATDIPLPPLTEGTGGEVETPHGDDPSRPAPPWLLFHTPCRPGICDICDDRRDRQWAYMEDC